MPFLKLLLTIFLWNSVIGVGFIGGRNCGTLIEIKTIKTLPIDPEDVEELECVFVEDEQSLIKYRQGIIEAKPRENFDFFQHIQLHFLRIRHQINS